MGRPPDGRHPSCMLAEEPLARGGHQAHGASGFSQTPNGSPVEPLPRSFPSARVLRPCVVREPVLLPSCWPVHVLMTLCCLGFLLKDPGRGESTGFL